MDARLVMQYDLEHLRLQNPSNWCWANSTFFGVTWALGCLDAFDPSTWGFQSAQLKNFLRQCTGTVAALIDESWFQQLLQSWDEPDRQHDCSEFVSAFLTWLNVPAFNMSWQRRMENRDVVQTLDESNHFQPVILQLIHPTAVDDTCAISDLFRAWHQVHGMKTALLEAAPLLCVHLDRMYQQDDGSLAKSLQKVDFLSPVHVPCFEGLDLRTSDVEYMIVSVACHYGHDGAGQYQAAMKLRPSVTGDTRPFQWMISQDDESDMLTWHVPERMVRNSTTFWMVRLDCLDLPLHHDWTGSDLADSPIIPSIGAIMSMLNERGLAGIETNHDDR